MEFRDHIIRRSFGLLGYGDSDEIAWVCYEAESVVFPLWNLSGKLVGYQAYNWKSEKIRKSDNPKEQRYFTRLPKGSHAAYGLQLIPEGYLGPIFLVEGIWEAIFGFAHGIPCLATLGCDPKGLKGWVDTISNEVYTLSQPDLAGKKLRKFGKSGYIGLSGDLDDCLMDGGWSGVPKEIREILERWEL